MAKLKICGLTCEADVAAVNKVKPDFAGFVIEVPGRRRSVTPEQVKVLVKGLNEETLPIGVFVDAPPELPISLLRDGTLWAAQLHGNEDEDYIEKIQNMTGKPVIKAFSIKTREDVEKAKKSSADYILLDHGKGGTGESFDWSLIRNMDRPYFLAGGLNAENVEQAMEPMFTTRPDLERSGMGFSFMEAFMDCLEVESTVGQGTRVIMEKKLGNAPWVSDPGQEEE